MSKGIDPSVERDIISWYSAGHSGRVTAALFGVSPRTVMRILERNGVPSRTLREASIRHTLRHDALDVLTPDAAYWCGFLFADGTVGHLNGTPHVTVALTASDRPHLVKLRSFLGSTHTITWRPGQLNRGYMSRPAVVFGVRSQHLADRILQLGRYGGPLNPELAQSRDFWRGVVDGDGHVGVHQGYPHCTVVGSEWLMRAYADFIRDLAGTRGLSVNTHKSIYQVGMAGAFAERVLRRLYDGASTSLDRKAAVTAQILEVAKFTILPPACIHGHLFDEANTYWWHGKRNCRKCCARRTAEFLDRRRQAAA